MANATYEIEKLYIEFFNRAADTPGLNFWVAQANAGSSITDIAHSMALSTEYHNIWGDNNQWSTNAYANTDRMFMNCFNRHPSSIAETQTWYNKVMDAMVWGKGTMADVEMQLADSATGADLITLSQKVNNGLLHPTVSLVGVQTAHIDHVSAA